SFHVAGPNAQDGWQLDVCRCGLADTRKGRSEGRISESGSAPARMLMCLIPQRGMCPQKAEALPHHVANALGWSQHLFRTRDCTLRSCELRGGGPLVLMLREALLAITIAVAVGNQQVRVQADFAAIRSASCWRTGAGNRSLLIDVECI